MLNLKMFLESLLSRKFMLTVFGVAALYSIHQYGEMVVLILGYLGVEGGADLVSRYKSRTLSAVDIKKAVSQNIGDDVDTDVVTTGKPSGTPLFNEKKEDE